MQAGLGVQALGLPTSIPEYRFTNATPDFEFGERKGGEGKKKGKKKKKQACVMGKERNEGEK